ncbi:MAG: hypothetical protein MRJ68_20165 [Nitrospira sp.]|nr:hypothetical protein [Nitrospira sp.]
MTQQATLAKKARKKSATRARSPRPWMLRHPELLSLVFRAFEDLTTLHLRCALEVTSARNVERLFGSILFEPDESGLQRWSWVAEMVTASRKVLDDMVTTNRLVHAECQGTYRRMLTIRLAWTQLEKDSKSLPLIDRITDCLRRVLIGYAAAQGRRTHRSRPPVTRDKSETGKARVREVLRG